MYTETFDDIYTIQIGRNQAENDQLVKSAPQTAWWFHLKDVPSPHGILYSDDGSEPTKNAIYRAAQLVKQYSKSKNLNTVSVDYCSIKNVKRTDVPGKVILTKRPDVKKV